MLCELKNLLIVNIFSNAKLHKNIYTQPEFLGFRPFGRRQRAEKTKTQVSSLYQRELKNYSILIQM